MGYIRVISPNLPSETTVTKAAGKRTSVDDSSELPKVGHAIFSLKDMRLITWYAIDITILLMEESGDHQLRLVVYPIIYKVLDIPGGAGFPPSTVLIIFK